MKEKLLPKTILFKKTLIVLCVLSGIEILIITLLGIYDSIYITPTQIHSKAFSISAEDIKSRPEDAMVHSELADLEIVPTDYDTLTKNFGSFSPHDLTTYLRYSEIVKSKDTTNLTNGYKYLKESNLNILIPQSYIDQYILTEVMKISQAMIQESSSTQTVLPYLEMNQGSSIHQNLSSCIKQDLNKFLTENSCDEVLAQIHNEELLPTLNFLTTSLEFTKLKSENTYDTYVNDQMYMYQINKVNTLVAASDNPESYSNDTFLDLDESHIHKAQLIINYLKALVNKLEYFSDNTKSDVNDLSTLITTLSTYRYGNDIPSQIKSLISNQLINITSNENSYAQANTTTSFLIKTFTVGSEPKTFIAPVYTFAGKDNQPIPALTFEINDNNFNEDYDVTPSAQSKGTVRLPIFMYHQIAQIPTGQSSFKTGLYVDPLDFEKQMAYLVKKNYKTISAQEYSDILKTGKNPTQKTVMLTFDDGVLNQYTNAYPILKKYGLTGVFYIISQRSGINQAQTKEMSDNGMDIGSHSAHHPDLMKVSDPNELSAEIISSKSSLQNATGKTVYSFAYPGCGYNSTTLSYVGSAGYAIAVSCGSTIDNYPGHAYTLSRVHAFGDMGSFKNLLSGVK